MSSMDHPEKHSVDSHRLESGLLPRGASGETTNLSSGSPTKELLDTSASTSPYPAGVTKAWLTVLGCFLIQFSTVASVNSFGVFQDFYASEFLTNSSASRISWIGSFEILLQLGLGAVGGKLCDMGHTRIVFAIGTVIYLVCFFMLSLTQSGQYYQVFLSQGFGMGIGVGLCYVPALVTAANHFPGRQAVAMGIVISSGSFGGAIFSIMLNELIPQIGFPWSVRTVAFLSLALLFIGNTLITVPPPAKKPSPTTSSSSTPTPNTNNNSSLTNPSYLLTLLSGSLGQLGGLFPLFYIQLFADSHHLARGFVFYSVAIMSFCTALGRVIPSWFADRYGAVGTFIVFEVAGAASIFIMFGANHPAGLIIFCILYGFIFGAMTSLFTPTITALMPSQADRGKLVGIAMFPVAIASLIGSPLAGAIIGSHLDWWKGVVFSGVLLGAAAGVQVVAREVNRKRRRV